MAALNITDDKQQRALLLYQAGPETQEIFETLTETGEDYKTVQEKLDAYFSPKKNVDYEIFQFRQAIQQPSETVVIESKKEAIWWRDFCSFDPNISNN